MSITPANTPPPQVPGSTSPAQARQFATPTNSLRTSGPPPQNLQGLSLQSSAYVDSPLTLVLPMATLEPSELSESSIIAQGKMIAATVRFAENEVSPCLSGSVSAIDRQDEEAGRTNLAADKAVHQGGEVTVESRPVAPSLLSGNVHLSPPTLDIAVPLFEGITHVLSESKDFDMSKTPIRSISLVSEPDRRNRILRIKLADSENRVIFKESHPTTKSGKTPTTEEIKDASDRFAKDWSGLEFASGLQADTPLCPKFYGGNKEQRFILQQDLGKNQTTLAHHILKGEAQEAKDSLSRYMTCMGKFHAAGHANIGHYLSILHRINPEAPVASIDGLTETHVNQLSQALALFGKTPSAEVVKEINTVVSSIYDPKGPFATVIHGDPCPDNVFDFPDKLLLIDFEFAAVSNALLDAVYPRMNMPSGWCAGAFPDDLLDTVEATYREEIKKQIPAAADDKKYFEAFAQACALHVLKIDLWNLCDVFEKDDTWGYLVRDDSESGVSVRSRVLSHLKTFIDISEKYDTLPALRSTFKELLQGVESKWVGAKPLALYPAFTKAV